jgi:hypothetical protein
MLPHEHVHVGVVGAVDAGRVHRAQAGAGQGAARGLDHGERGLQPAARLVVALLRPLEASEAKRHPPLRLAARGAIERFQERFRALELRARLPEVGQVDVGVAGGQAQLDLVHGAARLLQQGEGLLQGAQGVPGPALQAVQASDEGERHAFAAGIRDGAPAAERTIEALEGQARLAQHLVGDPRIVQEGQAVRAVGALGQRERLLIAPQGLPLFAQDAVEGTEVAQKRRRQGIAAARPRERQALVEVLQRTLEVPHADVDEAQPVEDLDLGVAVAPAHGQRLLEQGGGPGRVAQLVQEKRQPDVRAALALGVLQIAVERNQGVVLFDRGPRGVGVVDLVLLVRKLRLELPGLFAARVGLELFPLGRARGGQPGDREEWQE